jgi:hypothetical protein
MDNNMPNAQEFEGLAKLAKPGSLDPKIVERLTRKDVTKIAATHCFQVKVLAVAAGVVVVLIGVALVLMAIKR